MTSTEAAPRSTDERPWTQRTVESITRRLGRTRIGRRSFLTRTALLGSALAVDPIGFLLKPNTAWATVCGEDAEFEDGWSAFCATINDGANTCPSGSYPAGWWKIDNTTFCSGRARYIVDCNRSPGSSCNCRAANGECDHRRVCCNNFRYGQCNTHVKGTTEVVCRIVLCTPPWEWGNCTTTSLTSNQTRTHWSARLPSRTSPTAITVRWTDMGLAGSVLGRMVGSERSVDGGSWARFDHGVLTRRSGTSSTRLLLGPHAQRYASLGGPAHWLAHPRQDATGNPVRVGYDGGATWRTGDGVFVTTAKLDDYYDDTMGGPSAWMGPLTDDVQAQGPWTMHPTQSRWWTVHSRTDDVTRPLRSVSNLPADGTWPALVALSRWSGPNRYATATEMSRRSYPDGCDTVLVVSGAAFPDATTAGAITARLGAPILLTGRSQLPAATADEIRRLAPRRAVILGGTAAVTGSVVASLRDLVDVVARWSGDTRYGTAVEVSRNVFPDGADTVVIASGRDFPDSLTVAPLAHRRGAPLLLVDRDRIPGPVSTELRRLGASRAIIAGGTSAVGTGVAAALRTTHGMATTRLSGPNRYATSAAIAEELGGTGGIVMVATGNNFPDGLAAATSAALQGWPILLVDDGIADAVDTEIRRRRPERIVILGGSDAIGSRRAAQLGGYRA